MPSILRKIWGSDVLYLNPVDRELPPHCFARPRSENGGFLFRGFGLAAAPPTALRHPGLAGLISTFTISHSSILSPICWPAAGWLLLLLLRLLPCSWAALAVFVGCWLLAAAGLLLPLAALLLVLLLPVCWCCWLGDEE